MKRIFILVISVVLVGCGSFSLGMVSPTKGQSLQQREQDTLVCKDQAKNEANTSARAVGSFLAGLTIIGAPLAIESEKSKQREVFALCMTERGYKVEAPK